MTQPTQDAPSAKSKVNTQFSQTADGYRTSQVHAQGPEFAHLLQAANFQGHETVIDAGCGAGHTAAHVAPHVKAVLAVDLSSAMLQQAERVCTERGATNVSFIQGDVETLDTIISAAFPTATPAPIDAVVSRFSAHHWPHPPTALAAFQRILAPTGGRVFLVDVVSLDDFVYDTHLQAIELLRDPSHIRDHSIAQWVRMFDEAGFAAQPIYTWDLAIEFDDWITRMQTPPGETQTIRNLFDGAPDEVCRHFNLGAGSHSFTLPCAVIQAELR
ncbi:MAG: methyltransferase domain-containing protein [Litorilinea sp.]